MQVHNSLYINPSYITARYDVIERTVSETQISARIQNFRSNKFKGIVSKQSIRKIRLGVQWLLFMAKPKDVHDPATGKTVKYKAGLLTLSLPTGNEDLPPAFFRDTLLPSFLGSAKYYFNLENYIWKLERQSRGALHAHITIDQFLPYQWVLDTWCKILDKHGLLESYRERFAALTESEYIRYRQSADSRKYIAKFSEPREYLLSLRAAYAKGAACNWSKPNCTDIHSVRKVSNLAAYMAKYLTKDPKLGEGFKGRFWSCSQKLSQLRSVRVDLNDTALLTAGAMFDTVASGYKDIIYWHKHTGEPKFLGAIYFLKRSFRELMQVPILRDMCAYLDMFYHNSTLPDIPIFAYQGGRLEAYTPSSN